MLPPLRLDDSINSQLLVYRDLLVKWQKSVNLVAPSTVDEAWLRHFQDSLQVVPLVPSSVAVADIGSGAGFPGLVLAISRPDLSVTLIESDQKKCTFLLAVSRETGVRNVDVRVGRIETVLPGLKVDVVTARALAPLPKLLDLTRSQWVGANPANMVFMKGAGWSAEVAEARKLFAFDVDAQPSVTAAGAAVLCISYVADLRIA